MSRPRQPLRQRTVRQSMEEYGRGVAGGMLFSLPLIYTMEMWWAGFQTTPTSQLAYVALTLVLLLGYNRYAGLREDAGWTEVAIDSVEEMGLGLLLASLMLLLLGQITAGMPLSVIVGKIVVESMTVAVGISVGTAQLGGGGSEEETGSADLPHPAKSDDKDVPNTAAQIVLSFCGAVLFAASVAPTEEIAVIGAETSNLKLMGLVGLSMLLGAVILFYSDFTGSGRHVHRHSRWWIVGGMFGSYAAALSASALMLCFFHGLGSAPLAVPQVVVLSFPAMLGASAGRLLIQ